MNLLLTLALLSPAADADVDTLAHNIDPVVVETSLKQGDYRELPTSVTALSMERIENERIAESKNLSLVVPNLIHADYGSRMTSSIYLRGLGTRMDQPSVGLYIDNVPVLNKNSYDLDYFDIRRIDVLRGPQGTLYGRNTIGGVIDIHTLSPFDWQGGRFGAGYGSGNSWYIRGAVYLKPTEKFGLSIAANHSYSDGFFKNSHDGSHADKGRNSSLRFKLQARLAPMWMFENALYVNLAKQAGFAYAPYDETTGRVGKINHNDPCSYDKVGIVNGLTIRYDGPQVQLSSTTGYQFLSDEMTLDNDFSPASLFTLSQMQREHALTQEFVVRAEVGSLWEGITGAFGFYRHLSSRAPVTFKRDGIDQLILTHANAGLQDMFPDAELQIEDESFPIRSDFVLPSWGASLYHQSTFKVGRWKIVAGVRADWEHTAINYTNSATMRYRVVMPPADAPDFKPLDVKIDGNLGRGFFEVMPRAAVMFDTGVGNVYASVSRGYKAGGYNTQIFSDVVQNRMMYDLRSDIFSTTPASQDVKKAISYDPERSWNYELGSHLIFLDGRLGVDVALFYIDCRNQQLTVFPPGQGTGRMMSNAGRTRSFGAELSIDYTIGDFRLAGAYGYNDARFIRYKDSQGDYRGNYVPYAPRHTMSVQAEYGISIDDRWKSHFVVSAGVQGAGQIMWNEANTIFEQFYALVNASIAWRTDMFELSLWGKNLTGTRYNTFYFRSVGRSFVQQGKPLQAGISLSLRL